MPASGWSRGRSRRLALRRLTPGRGAPLRAPLRRETGSGALSHLQSAGAGGRGAARCSAAVRRGRVLCLTLVTGSWRGGPPASPPGRHEALGMLLPSLRSGAALALFAVKLMSTPACARSRPGVGKGRPLPTPGHACPRLATPAPGPAPCSDAPPPRYIPCRSAPRIAPARSLSALAPKNCVWDLFGGAPSRVGCKMSLGDNRVGFIRFANSSPEPVPNANNWTNRPKGVPW